MAISLADGACIIYEIPRTGTTWMRHALTRLGVPWEEAPSVDGVCNRHGLPEHYPGQYDVRECVERETVDWLESYWSHHHDMALEVWTVNTHYPHRIFGPPMEERFEGLVERLVETNPDCIRRYMDSFHRSCNLTLKFENLTEDFHSLLERCGYPVDIESVRSVGRRNESKNRTTLNVVPEHLLEAIRSAS